MPGQWSYSLSRASAWTTAIVPHLHFSFFCCIANKYLLGVDWISPRTILLQILHWWNKIHIFDTSQEPSSKHLFLSGRSRTQSLPVKACNPINAEHLEGDRSRLPLFRFHCQWFSFFFGIKMAQDGTRWHQDGTQDDDVCVPRRRSNDYMVVIFLI